MEVDDISHTTLLRTCRKSPTSEVTPSRRRERKAEVLFSRRYAILMRFVLCQRFLRANVVIAKDQ